MGDSRALLGRNGERAVAAWLVARGWRVIAERWRGTSGELDLVCRDPEGWLVGVEVKVRRSGRSGTGAESITPRRLSRLRRTIVEYAGAHRSHRRGIRLDLVELTPAEAGRWHLRREPGIVR